MWFLYHLERDVDVSHIDSTLVQKFEPLDEPHSGGRYPVVEVIVEVGGVEPVVVLIGFHSRVTVLVCYPIEGTGIDDDRIFEQRKSVLQETTPLLARLTVGPVVFTEGQRRSQREERSVDRYVDAVRREYHRGQLHEPPFTREPGGLEFSPQVVSEVKSYRFIHGPDQVNATLTVYQKRGFHAKTPKVVDTGEVLECMREDR